MRVPPEATGLYRAMLVKSGKHKGEDVFLSNVRSRMDPGFAGGSQELGKSLCL